MATSYKDPSISHDTSTDTDDDRQYDSDSTKDGVNDKNDKLSSTNLSSKYRG